jgi:hypothetical protein
MSSIDCSGSWIIRAYKIPEYLDQVIPNYDLLKLTAQALAGTSLAGSRDLISTTQDEKTLCERLLANWGKLIEENRLFKRE